MLLQISKLFHKILAKCLEAYLLSNSIINPILQNRFPTGINSTEEDILTSTAIIYNAIWHGIPLAVSFFALQNAFGSVAHVSITDALTNT